MHSTNFVLYKSLSNKFQFQKMSLKLYMDLMSQPSRTLYILLKTAKCNFEPKKIDLARREQLTKEFAAINRFQKVPVIDHNGFILTESVAIIKYLSRENLIPDSLYPKESKQRARVDEFMEWQHTGLRFYTGAFFVTKYLEPMKTGQAADPKLVASYERLMIKALEEFSTKWIGRGTDFIVGDNITAADVQAVSEIEQTRVAGFDAKEKFPVIATWVKKVQEHCNPHYDEAFIILNKVIERQAKMAKKA